VAPALAVPCTLLPREKGIASLSAALRALGVDSELRVWCASCWEHRKAQKQRLAGGGKEEGKHVPAVSRETTRPVGRTHVREQRDASAAAAASARAGLYLALSY
jgi:hypothetical protein